MSKIEKEQSSVLYPLDSRPPLPRALVLGLQHVLTMFGATVSVPLLFQSHLEMDARQLAILVSSVMICSGVATAMQVTIGTRLPIIQGVSFSFLAAFFACIAYAKANPVEGVSHGALSMQYIAGAIIAGSFVEIFLGFTGLFGKLRKVVTPVVIGPVIMLIGLALFEHGAPKAGTHWPVGGATMALVVFFSLVLANRYRIFRVLPVLLAVVTMWGVCAALTFTGVFGPEHPAHVNVTGVGATPWLRFNLFWGEFPILMPWGAPKFELGLIVAALAGYLASMIESFGDYHGAAAMAEAPDPSDKQISRGIGSEGLGCLGTGLLGGFSSTSYSENIALIGLTRVASRHVVLVSAGILLLLGAFAKFGAVVATIPGPLVGGLYCALFGLISAVGIQQLSKADLYSQRTLFIAGFSLFMGLSVPKWFAGSIYGTPGAKVVQDALDPTLASIVVALGSTGMGVAALIGLFLDNVIPGTDAERGIATAPESETPAGDNA
jgi:uracil-xanthine permease